MVDPTQPDAADRRRGALRDGECGRSACSPPCIVSRCRTNRAGGSWRCRGGGPGTAVFVHCGVLSVGVRKKLGPAQPVRPALRQSAGPRTPSRWAIPRCSHRPALRRRSAARSADGRRRSVPNVLLDTSSSNGWIKYQAGPDARRRLPSGANRCRARPAALRHRLVVLSAWLGRREVTCRGSPPLWMSSVSVAEVLRTRFSAGISTGSFRRYASAPSLTADTTDVRSAIPPPVLWADPPPSNARPIFRCSRSRSRPKSPSKSRHTEWMWLPSFCVLSYSTRNVGPWMR